MTEHSIPDPSMADIAALLGVEEPTTPEAKAALAKALEDALTPSGAATGDHAGC